MILKSGGDICYKMYGVNTQIMKCYRCNNMDRSLFYTFYDQYHNAKITYCLNCINLGRSDSVTPLNMIETERRKETCHYHLAFSLSEIQSAASNSIVEAVENTHHILLYAVTGAGKTEITFEGIKRARSKGKRVAFVSPRIDVVKEVYLRLTEAFQNTRIGLMYAGVKVEFEHMFTVCTVHQLYNYVHHFDVIIIDEYDAYPLEGNVQLLSAIDRARTKTGIVIIMTATPTKKMVNYVGKENVVTITRRYHGHDLAIPKVIYSDVEKQLKRHNLPKVLVELIESIVDKKRRVLIFVPKIAMLKQVAPIIAGRFKHVSSVYSADKARYTKVEAMRSGDIDIMITTTILERGVTFNNLDVIVLHSEQFKSDSLIQICGRVGRKVQDPSGHIYFLTAYNTGDIKKARRVITQFNHGRALI